MSTLVINIVLLFAMFISFIVWVENADTIKKLKKQQKEADAKRKKELSEIIVFNAVSLTFTILFWAACTVFLILNAIAYWVKDLKTPEHHWKIFSSDDA